MRQRQEAGEAEVHEFKQALAQMERKVGVFKSLSPSVYTLDLSPSTTPSFVGFV